MFNHLYLIIFCIATFSLQAFSAVESTTGQIKFDVNSDQSHELYLNSTGLGVGVTPTANLHVQGNTIISTGLNIGNNYPVSSTLNLGGTLGMAPISYGAGSNTLGDSSLFLVDTSSGNAHLNLPSAASYQGRVIQIKRISTLNNLYLSASSNLIDNYTTLGFLPGNLTSLEMVSDGKKWYLMGTPTNESLSEIGNSSLYLWWKLDESSGNVAGGSDASTRSGNLSNEHSFSGNSVTGVLNTALQMDDIYDTVRYESGSGLTSTGYTYSFWAYGNKSPSDSLDYSVAISGTAGFCWGYRDASYRQTAYHKLSGGTYVSANIHSTLSANTWYHLAVSWDGANLKIYLNGTYESGNTATSWAGASNVILSHAGSFDGNVYMDDMRYFSSALDIESIKALYQAGVQ